MTSARFQIYQQWPHSEPLHIAFLVLLGMLHGCKLPMWRRREIENTILQNHWVNLAEGIFRCISRFLWYHVFLWVIPLSCFGPCSTNSKAGRNFLLCVDFLRWFMVYLQTLIDLRSHAVTWRLRYQLHDLRSAGLSVHQKGAHLTCPDCCLPRANSNS